MATKRITTPTEAELLDALAGALVKSAAPADARTTKQLMEATGRCRDTIMRSLSVLARQGRLGVHRIQRPSLDGYLRTTTAYTILPQKR